MYKGLLTIAAAGAMAVGSAGAIAAQSINGAGATFPYPVYSKWADAYQSKTQIGLNYQAIGSGGGIQQISARTVTFGASDAPLKPEELEKNSLVQWPQITGGVVPVVNIEGVGKGALKLDGKTLAEIYLGDIKSWDDKAIAKLNPDADLPSTQITPVYRAEGSGTNFLFTHYLSQVSSSFESKVGEGKSVAWPSGVGAKANAGVAKQVGQTKGAIGYVEYAYAVENNLNVINLKNKAGKFVKPEIDSFKAAASNADWQDAKGMYLVLTNQPGDASWPIVGASFILMHTDVRDPKAAKRALEFFDWAYKNGDSYATQLNYVPIPTNVAKLVRSQVWNQIEGDNGNKVWQQ